jgi:anti-anti-sigma regulatory factor
MATRSEPHAAERQASPGGAALEVERGPDWLFVQMGDSCDGARSGLTESVWETIREHGASRVVLELDRVERVDETLGEVIATIGARMRDAGGLIRICGLSPTKLSQLRSVAAVTGVPHFDSRGEAVGTRRVGAGSCE